MTLEKIKELRRLYEANTVIDKYNDNLYDNSYENNIDCTYWDLKNQQYCDMIDAYDEYIASLQPTQFEDIRLYHENTIKGEVLQMSQHEKGTLVQVLIRHEVK